MPDHVRGRTRLAGLFELIQVSEMHRRTVALTVSHKTRQGKIFIQDGVLCDASYAHLRGDDAIVEILRWIESFFELAPMRQKVKRTINSPTVNLLISALKGMGHVELPSSRSEDSIIGPLELMSATEILQLFEMNHRNAFIMLRRNGAVGTVHLRDGKAVNAAVGQSQGNEALIKLLTWRDGHFRVRFAEEYVLSNITDSIHSLVMEATRRLDEQKMQAG